MTITIGFMMCMAGLMVMPANVTAAAPQQWHNDQALSASSALGVAVTGPDNQIYNFGGGIMTYSNHSVRYNPVTGSSTNLTPMPKALVSPVAAYFMGSIYLVGGRTADGSTAGILYQYDIQHDSWSVRASMPKGVYRAMGVMDDTGKLWVAGGYNSTDAAATSAVQIYNTATNTWSSGTSMPGAVFSGVGFKADGNLYVAGGTDGTNVLATVNALSFSGGAWTAKAAMPSANAWMGVAMGKDGQAYLIGGSPSVGGSFTSAVSSTLIYNPDANSWQSGPALPEKVYGPSTAATSDGVVWRIGGVTTSSSASRNVSSLNVMTVTDTVSPSTTIGTGRDMLVTVNINMAFRPLASFQGTALLLNANGSSYASQSFSSGNSSSAHVALTVPQLATPGSYLLSFGATTIHDTNGNSFVTDLNNISLSVVPMASTQDQIATLQAALAQAQHNANTTSNLTIAQMAELQSEIAAMQNQLTSLENNNSQLKSSVDTNAGASIMSMVFAIVAVLLIAIMMVMLFRKK